MKLFILALIIIIPCFVNAQKLKGNVIDKETGLPVIYATVFTSNASTVTSYTGKFQFDNLSGSDTLRVRSVGYSNYKIAVRDIHADTLIIYLHQSSIMLHDVNINARKNFKQDSINLRKQFSAAFDYKGTTFKDLFSTVNPYAYTPYDYITAPNNATMLVNVNLLSVISMLGKKKAPQTKLQQTLLQDEANNYVDQRFSKQRITAETGMTGDSLTSFMMMYRPAIDQTKKMSDYQMMLYIKKSYTDFIKTYDPKRSLLVP